MRHRKSINHLGRTSAHRKAMLANMAASLILHKRITTTTAKAKALKMYVEPLITKTKDLTKVEEKTHAQRVVFSYLKNKYAVKELFGEIAEKVADRPGGYTRILKTGTRLGDNADMCIIELVDYNETYSTGKSAAKSKSTRRRRSTKKATAETTTEKVDAKVEEVKTEEPKAEVVETVEEVKAEAETVVEEKAEEAPEKTEEEKKEE